MTTQNGLMYFGFLVNSVMFYSMIYLTDNDVYIVLLDLIVIPPMWKSYEYFVGLLILSTADMLSGAMLEKEFCTFVLLYITFKSRERGKHGAEEGASSIAQVQIHFFEFPA